MVKGVDRFRRTEAGEGVRDGGYGEREDGHFRIGRVNDACLKVRKKKETKRLQDYTNGPHQRDGTDEHKTKICETSSAL